MSDEFQAENSSDMEKLKRRLDDLGDLNAALAQSGVYVSHRYKQPACCSENKVSVLDNKQMHIYACQVTVTSI